jgi:hypothetical protein
MIPNFVCKISIHGHHGKRLLATALALGMFAQSTASAQSEPVSAPVKGAAISLYSPPVPNAPRTRVGGVSRSAGNVSVRLAVLTPDHMGFTSRDQPTLYWYLSQPVKAQVEITLTTQELMAPVLKKTLSAANISGVQSISLAEHGIRLEPDIDYRWHVALVLDQERRSKDIIASGAIRRIDPALQPAGLEGKNAEQRTVFYAENGLWYDALENSRSAELSDAQLKLFDTLIEQAGLKIPAP